MKIRIFILLGLFGLFSSLSAQVLDLMKLAKGSLIFSQPVYDSDEHLYGYFFMYEQDAEIDSKKLEYVLLDKNMNKVNNGEFSIPYNKKVNYKYYDCTLIDNKIVLSKNYYTGNYNTNYLVNTFQVLSLDSQTVSDEYIYKDDRLIKAPSDLMTLKEQNAKLETKNIVSAFASKSGSGFYITEYNKKHADYLERDLVFFDKDLNFKWKYEYNPDGKTKLYNSFHFLHFKNNTLYIAETKWVNKKAEGYKIVALDFTTGKKKYEYQLESSKDTYVHRLKTKEIDGNLYIVGDYMENPKNMIFDYTKRQGIYRVVLDGSGNVLNKKYLPWSTFSPDAILNKNGRDKAGFYLLPVNYFIFKDGSVSILTEKYKPLKKGISVPIFLIDILVYSLTYKPPKTSDFQLLNFDKDFNINGTELIHKEATEYNRTDFLFSQYIHNESAAAFFYRNSFKNNQTKKQDVILGINVLKEGKLTQEKIPLYSKKQYYIDVLPAKEGYIMLREYNEKDKYNQIRLEKLNYE